MSAGIVVHPAGNTSLVLSFSPLYQVLCLCLSLSSSLFSSFSLPLPLFPSPSRSPFVQPPRRRPLSPASSFFQYESTAMIPPIVSLDVRRSMVQKFGITVSTMFNRESTHNVECVGLSSAYLSIGGSSHRVPRCVIYERFLRRRDLLSAEGTKDRANLQPRQASNLRCYST